MTGVSALPDRLKVLFKKHSVHSYTSLESVPISLMTGVLALSIWLKVTFKRLLDFSWGFSNIVSRHTYTHALSKVLAGWLNDCADNGEEDEANAYPVLMHRTLKCCWHCARSCGTTASLPAQTSCTTSLCPTSSPSSEFRIVQTSAWRSNSMYRVGQNCIYVCTVYDRISGDFPAKIPYMHRTY